MIGFLSFLSVYVREMFFAILTFFGITVTETGIAMKVVFALVAGLCVFVFLYQMLMKYSISIREIIVLFILLTFVLFYILYPKIVYGSANPNYQGQMLAGCASSIPAFLMGLLIKRSNKLDELCKVLPFFIIFNTVVSLGIALFTSGTTSAGYISDGSGFNYQSLSYFIVYTLALNIFYIKCQNSFENYKLFSKPGWNTFFQCLIPVQIFILFVSGGRGAFVLLLVLIVYYFIIDYKNYRKNLKNFTLLALAFFVVVLIINSIDITYLGFNRIIGLLEGEVDRGRFDTYESAMRFFTESVVFGHGPGSELFLFPAYIHNIFGSMLVEYGIVGLIVFLILLTAFVIRLSRSIKKDSKNHLIMLMFICGFTFSLFSGYYFSVTIIWFTLGYTFSSTYSNDSTKIRIRVR